MKKNPVVLKKKGDIDGKHTFSASIKQQPLTQEEWLEYNKKITGIDLSVYFGDPQNLKEKYGRLLTFDLYQANEDYDLKIIRMTNRASTFDKISLEVFDFSGLHNAGIKIKKVKYILYSTSVIIVPKTDVDTYLNHIKQSWGKHKAEETRKENIREKLLKERKKLISDIVDRLVEKLKKIYKWAEYKKKINKNYPKYKFNIEEEFLIARKKLKDKK